MPQKKDRLKSFGEFLLEAIDEALSSLGESVKAAIYFHLEHSFNIKRQEIPNRIADFSEALGRIFGPGARHLELLFMKSIHSKIKIICKWPEPEWPLSKWLIPELTFQDYVKLMQQQFEATQESRLEMGILSYERETTSK